MNEQPTDTNKNLRENLAALAPNFSRIDPETRRVDSDFAAPTPEEIAAYQASNGGVHPAIGAMLGGDDDARKLYAAILLGATEAKTSAEILRELSENSRQTVKIQKSIGHGTIEIPVKYAAQSLFETGSVRKGFAEFAELSSGWRIAAQQEARRRNQIFDADRKLPSPEKVFEAAQTAASQTEMRREMRELAAADIISARFYAVVVLRKLGDRQAADEILQSLITDETPVPILTGDVMREVAAGEIARSQLETTTPNAEREPPRAANDFLSSLKAFFFGKD